MKDKIKRPGYVVILLLILVSLAAIAIGTTCAYLTTIKTTAVQTVTVADPVPSPAQVAADSVPEENSAQDSVPENGTAVEENNAQTETSSWETAESNPVQGEETQQ